MYIIYICMYIYIYGAFRCNTLAQIVSDNFVVASGMVLGGVGKDISCNTLQYAATHRITLQHTAMDHVRHLCCCT